MQPGTAVVRSGSSSSLIRRRSRSSAGFGIGTAESNATVYGVLRRGEDVVGIGNLDEAAAVHHCDAVAHVSQGREVVRDEEVGQTEAALQLHQEVEDLRAHGDVERRDRLVADDERRVGRERARDRHPLPLPTGQLERSPLAEVGVEPNELQQLGTRPRWRRAARRSSSSSGSATICSTVISGSSESPDPGTPSARGRAALPGPCLPASSGRPSNVTSPRVRGVSPRSSRATVDLPDPDSPTRPSDSPLLMSKDTPRRRGASACAHDRLGRGSPWPGRPRRGASSLDGTPSEIS